MPAPLVVGFDLDMTLVDTRPGIAAVWDAISAETGVAVDSAACVARLGPPLADEVANWFPPERVDEVVTRYRALYPDLAIAPSPLLPGAREAVDAVRRHGGTSVVVTAKYEPSARLHLRHLDIDADVVGDLYAQGKAVALRERGASVYVGDHIGDVLGAKAAGAVAVAVASGPVSADELRAAGADVVLDDLHQFAAWLDEHVLTTRLGALDELLRSYERLLVAFSGGADSALVLAAAARALGPANVLAATAVSPSLPAAELAAAAAFADGQGVRHLAVGTDEMSREGYAANAGDRCYFCKAELLDVLAPVAAAHEMPAVATGTNADDAVAGFRPGIRAAAERGAVTPLRDVGLTKAQIRAASRRLGLSTWDKPAAACLSSRVAYGVRITPHRLARVDRAEAALRTALLRAGIPVRDLRVRDLGDDARVELDPAGLDAVNRRPELLDAVEGFRSVVLDPAGFRSGSMNEALAEPERYR